MVSCFMVLLKSTLLFLISSVLFFPIPSFIPFFLPLSPYLYLSSFLLSWLRWSPTNIHARDSYNLMFVRVCKYEKRYGKPQLIQAELKLLVFFEMYKQCFLTRSSCFIFLFYSLKSKNLR